LRLVFSPVDTERPYVYHAYPVGTTPPSPPNGCFCRPRVMRTSTQKIVTIVGARPQFIKAAVVSRALARNEANRPGAWHEVLVHTGQHHDANMSEIFFDEMRIPRPAHHLGIAGGSHGSMTGRMLEAVERVLLEEHPDVVLVYGDTNSTLAGALAAAKLHLPVAHVEAGLRSFNRRMPEEINRVLTDHLAEWLFAPTEAAVANLAREGILAAKVWLVGDVMLDAALFYQHIAQPSDATRQLLDKLPGGFFLATLHRAENTDDPRRLGALLSALAELSATRPVVLPLHPRTRKLLGQWAPPSSVYVLDPVGYFDMLALLNACCAVLTDSGGLQKEAFFFSKRCVVMRDETEWVELVDAGHNVLAGADAARIVSSALSFLNDRPRSSPALYGDGHAGERILDALDR